MVEDALGNWDLLACGWQPGADLLDDNGRVRPEIVWSALDCPGYFAAGGEALPATLLGELSLDIMAPVPGDVRFCSLVMWTRSWPETSSNSSWSSIVRAKARSISSSTRPVARSATLARSSAPSS